MILLILLLSLVICVITIFSHLKSQHGLVFNLLISLFIFLSFLSILYSIHLFCQISYEVFIFELLLFDIISLIILNKSQLKALNDKFYLKSDNSLILFSFFVLIGTILFWGKTNRWGEWDAWAIWNLHAKFLIEEEFWTNLFTDKISWTHPDYPLMLPSLIAIFWKGIGIQNPIVPAIIAYVVLLSILCLMYISIPSTNPRTISLFAVLFLIIDFQFISQISSQYADSLVALFILISVILISKNKDESYSYFILIGLFSSLPIWVKNEGNVFFIFTSIFIVIQNYTKRINILSYMLGAIPIILITIFFKLYYAPVNDLTGSLGGNTLEKIISFDRYLMVIQNLMKTILKNYPLLLILPFKVLLLHRKAIISWVNIIILSTLSTYLFVYIITPHDLEWHLEHSLDRLIHQLYPACVYSFLSVINKFYPSLKSDFAANMEKAT